MRVTLSLMHFTMGMDQIQVKKSHSVYTLIHADAHIYNGQCGLFKIPKGIMDLHFHKK
jgi:hypothetical protein